MLDFDHLYPYTNAIESQFRRTKSVVADRHSILVSPYCRCIVRRPNVMRLAAKMQINEFVHMYHLIILTSIIVLIDCFQPAEIVMRMRYNVNVDNVGRLIDGDTILLRLVYYR